MAPKKRTDTIASSTTAEPPMVLLQEALDDLRYLEPTRTRDRVISALNEAFMRIMALEQLHQEPNSARPKPKRR